MNASSHVDSTRDEVMYFVPSQQCVGVPLVSPKNVGASGNPPATSCWGGVKPQRRQGSSTASLGRHRGLTVLPAANHFWKGPNLCRLPLVFRPSAGWGGPCGLLTEELPTAG